MDSKRIVTRLFLPTLLLVAGLVVFVATPVQEAVAGQSLGLGSGPPGTSGDPIPSNDPTSGAPVGSTAADPQRVLLVGESVALTLGMGLSANAGRYGIDFSDQATLGCGIAQGEPLTINGQTWKSVTSTCDGNPDDLQWPLVWADEVSSFEPDVVLLSVGRWEIVNRYWGGTWTNITDTAYQSYLTGQLQMAVQVLSAKGAHIVFLTSPYFDGGNYPENAPARVTIFNSLLEKVAAEQPSTVSVLDLSAYVDPGGKYQSEIDGIEVRDTDGVHFTVPGGEWVGKWLWPQVRTLGRATPENVGYDVVTSRGEVMSEGDGRWAGDTLVFPPLGSTASVNSPGAGSIGAATETPDGRGYWLAAPNGTVYAFGSARFEGPGSVNPAPVPPVVGTLATGGAQLGGAGLPGSVTTTSGPPGVAPPPLTPPTPTGMHFAAPVVAIASTHDGRGYWLADRGGSVYAFGDARYFASAGLGSSGSGKQASPGVPGKKYSSPVVAMAVTPDGRGYWLAASDGSVYSFGDADFHGAAAATAGAPIVSIAPTHDGRGYWLAASDGSVYSFGDADFHGAAAATAGAPIVSIAPTHDGRGYWLSASDGSVYSFGDAPIAGSWSGVPLQSSAVALLPS